MQRARARIAALPTIADLRLRSYHAAEAEIGLGAAERDCEITRMALTANEEIARLLREGRSWLTSASAPPTSEPRSPTDLNRPPPRDSGKRLATIHRDDGEIGISWCMHEGRPFVSIRFWSKGTDGALYPDRARGIAIRVRELADLADGIAAALDEAEAFAAAKVRAP